MSNNKQSSIEFLYNKMYEHRGNITIEEYEQAKEMHEQEIMNSFVMGLRNWDSELMPEDYYKQTFNK
jgi:hypothetical protein